jgi:CRISPR/Cas system-associated exonuclease Cas4 (RecB family)
MINTSELRETLGGNSFLKKFHQCERSFYYRYIEGLMPVKTNEALVFGSALHEAAAKYWEGQSLHECLNHGLEVINELSVMFDESKVNLLRLKLRLVFPKLYDVLNELKNDYDYIEHESTFYLRLLNGDIALKPDIVLRNKHSKRLVVFDYKTTGKGIGVQVDDQMYSNQPRLYSAGIKKKYKLDYFPVWQTIEVYSRKVAYKDEFNISIQIAPLSMEEREIRDVLLSYEGLLQRLSQTYQSFLLTGNFKILTHMGECAKCAFKDICLQRLSNVNVNELEGFELDPWKEQGLIEGYLKTGKVKGG